MPKLTDWLKERALQENQAAADSARALPLRRSAWYKINGMAVHVLGAKLPPNCVRCKAPSSILCDYPVTEGVTCSAPLCTGCAKEVGKNKHLCPIHAKKILTDSGSLL